MAELQDVAEGRRAVVPWGVAEVHGPSMVPTLRAGDRVLVRYGDAARPGAVVVLRHPLQQDLLVVKRAVERRPGGWWVLGDNPYAGGDSRDYGVVPEELVLGRVHVRFRPPPGRDERSSPWWPVAWALGALRPVITVRTARAGRAPAPGRGGPEPR